MPISGIDLSSSRACQPVLGETADRLCGDWRTERQLDIRILFASLLVVMHCLPVNWLHLSGDAYYRFWWKLLKFLEKVSDVGPVFEVQVKLHYAHQTWKRSTKQKLQPSVPSDNKTKVCN